MIPAIEQNFQQREIAEASFRYQSEVERGERVVVGVNRYEQEDEQPIEILRIDPALEQKQVERVQAVRERRDTAAAEAALARLKEDAAHEDRNLMEPIMDASRAYVTMGEMCDALREVWGTWRETAARSSSELRSRISAQGRRRRARGLSGWCRSWSTGTGARGRR